MAKARLTINLDHYLTEREQIREQIARKVKQGAWSPGNRLPTVRQIALDLTISANAVSRICAVLADEGMLMRREGCGTYAIDMRELAGLQPETVALINS